MTVHNNGKSVIAFINDLFIGNQRKYWLYSKHVRL